MEGLGRDSVQRPNSFPPRSKDLNIRKGMQICRRWYSDLVYDHLPSKLDMLILECWVSERWSSWVNKCIADSNPVTWLQDSCSACSPPQWPSLPWQAPTDSLALRFSFLLKVILQPLSSEPCLYLRYNIYYIDVNYLLLCYLDHSHTNYFRTEKAL